MTYQVLSNGRLVGQNSSAQQDLHSMQQQVTQLKTNISNLTSQNDAVVASIRELNLTASTLGRQIGVVNTYLGMRNVTTLVANRTITVWPAQTAPRYVSPNMTFILSFTAKYAGYLSIRSNVTTDAFIQVQILFAGCVQHTAICQTTWGPSFTSYRPQVFPILPGSVTVSVGSFAPISPQRVWISIVYVS